MYNKMSNTRYIFGRRDKGLEQAYLDNSATTPVCPQAVEAAVRMMTACFGNPSSLHTLGIQAEKELSAARESVAPSDRGTRPAASSSPRAEPRRTIWRFLAAGPPVPARDGMR